MVRAAGHADPATGLAAVAALRGVVEVLEELQVDNARAHGWSWHDIARVLGVTKQAVHYKHAGRLRGRRLMVFGTAGHPLLASKVDQASDSSW